jgi:hypothetical protein
MTGSALNAFNQLLQKVKVYVDNKISALVFSKTTVTDVSAENILDGLVLNETVTDLTTGIPVITTRPIVDIISGKNTEFIFSTIGGLLTLSIGTIDEVMSFGGTVADLTELYAIVPSQLTKSVFYHVLSGAQNEPSNLIYVGNGTNTPADWVTLTELPPIADMMKQVVQSVNEIAADGTGNVTLSLSGSSNNVIFPIASYSGAPAGWSVNTNTTINYTTTTLGASTIAQMYSMSTAPVIIPDFSAGLPASFTLTGSFISSLMPIIQGAGTSQMFTMELTRSLDGTIESIPLIVTTAYSTTTTSATINVTMAAAGMTTTPDYYSNLVIKSEATGSVNSVNGIFPDLNGDVNLPASSQVIMTLLTPTSQSTGTLLIIDPETGDAKALNYTVAGPTQPVQVGAQYLGQLFDTNPTEEITVAPRFWINAIYNSNQGNFEILLEGANSYGQNVSIFDMDTIAFVMSTTTAYPSALPVPVPQGGTGVGAISGLVKGNGTGPFSPAVASDLAASGGVTSINGMTPDASGNIPISVSESAVAASIRLSLAGGTSFTFPETPTIGKIYPVVIYSDIGFTTLDSTGFLQVYQPSVFSIGTNISCYLWTNQITNLPFPNGYQIPAPVNILFTPTNPTSTIYTYSAFTRNIIPTLYANNNWIGTQTFTNATVTNQLTINDGCVIQNSPMYGFATTLDLTAYFSSELGLSPTTGLLCQSRIGSNPTTGTTFTNAPLNIKQPFLSTDIMYVYIQKQVSSGIYKSLITIQYPGSDGVIHTASATRTVSAGVTSWSPWIDLNPQSLLTTQFNHWTGFNTFDDLLIGQGGINMQSQGYFAYNNNNLGATQDMQQLLLSIGSSVAVGQVMTKVFTGASGGTTFSNMPSDMKNPYTSGDTLWITSSHNSVGVSPYVGAYEILYVNKSGAMVKGYITSFTESTTGIRTWSNWSASNLLNFAKFATLNSTSVTLNANAVTGGLDSLQVNNAVINITNADGTQSTITPSATINIPLSNTGTFLPNNLNGSTALSSFAIKGKIIDYGNNKFEFVSESFAQTFQDSLNNQQQVEFTGLRILEVPGQTNYYSCDLATSSAVVSDTGWLNLPLSPNFTVPANGRSRYRIKGGTIELDMYGVQCVNTLATGSPSMLSTSGALSSYMKGQNVQMTGQQTLATQTAPPVNPLTTMYPTTNTSQIIFIQVSSNGTVWLNSPAQLTATWYFTGRHFGTI